MSAVGTWKLVVKGPTGPMSSVLELNEVNGTLTGTQSGQGNTSEILAAKVDGDAIYWENVTTKPMKMKLEFRGTLNGDEIVGKVKAGMMGSYPFVATRQ